MASTGSSRRFLRKALGASTVLHLSLVALLLADAVRPFLLPRPELPDPDQVVLLGRSGPPLQPFVAETLRVEISPSAMTSEEAGRHPADVFAARIARSVEQAAVTAQEKTPEEQLDQLKQLAGQLGGISSEKSVDEMAGKFRQWLGTSRRAERPAAQPVGGEFEFATAQLHDVRREDDEEAGYVYFAVLVDAAGRRAESRMEPLEGESAYKTMQLMKANPLAEMVYRRIVMGFMDNIIKTGKEAEAAKPRAEAQRGP